MGVKMNVLRNTAVAVMLLTLSGIGRADLIPVGVLSSLATTFDGTGQPSDSQNREARHKLIVAGLRANKQNRRAQHEEAADLLSMKADEPSSQRSHHSRSFLASDAPDSASNADPSDRSSDFDLAPSAFNSGGPEGTNSGFVAPVAGTMTGITLEVGPPQSAGTQTANNDPPAPSANDPPAPNVPEPGTLPSLALALLALASVQLLRRRRIDSAV